MVWEETKTKGATPEAQRANRLGAIQCQGKGAPSPKHLGSLLSSDVLGLDHELSKGSYSTSGKA